MRRSREQRMRTSGHDESLVLLRAVQSSADDRFRGVEVDALATTHPVGLLMFQWYCTEAAVGW